jgi:hypothetical protein
MPDGLQVGWNSELDIPAALSRVPASQLASYFVLVSTIDSTTNVSQLPSLLPLLMEHRRWYSVVESDVVIEIPTLELLVGEHDFLTGFDEIWLFKEIPRTGKPRHLRMTSDVPLEPRGPEGLSDWMVESFCCAGLGDGDGLNYATFEPALAAAWKRSTDAP